VKILVIRIACGLWTLKLLDCPKVRPSSYPKSMTFMHCPRFKTKEEAVDFANEFKKSEIMVEEEKFEINYFAQKQAQEKKEKLILEITKIIKEELGKHDTN
jgi:hypothetical protein